MQFQEPNEELKQLSIKLHHALCDAGFTAERVRLQTLLVDYIENLYRDLYDNEQYYWSIAGSFGDVWGNNLFTFDGRTDEHESDVDWTCVMRRSIFHFKETCKCVDVDKKYVLSQENVREGHIKFNFEQLREPAELHEAIGLRPKVDECTAYRCCSVPPGLLCGHVGNVFDKVEVADELTLIQASRPGYEHTELRFGFANFEKRKIRLLNVIQGQLFLLIKYFVTNKFNKDVYAFKSYHAKTLLFFMLAEFHADKTIWKAENLVSLLLHSFDFLIEEMGKRKCANEQESQFYAAMRSFFLEGCFIYFHKKVFSDQPHDTLIDVVQRFKNNIKVHIDEYIDQLRPLGDHKGFIFNPYVLFPTRLTLQFYKKSASTETLYLRVYNCLQELIVLTADRKTDFLRHIESLPPNAFTVSLCLKVMTHLKFGEKDAAVQLLRKHQFHSAQYTVPFQEIKEEDIKNDLSRTQIAAKLKREIESTDTAWCFAFTYDQLRSLEFEFLDNKLYDHCITRSRTYPVDVVVDFNCLTRLFHLLLCEDRGMLETWRNDLELKKAPLSEVYLFNFFLTSDLPASKRLPKMFEQLNESIGKKVFYRNFLIRLIKDFDSERSKIFSEWLEASIESSEFLTLYCASIVSDKKLLSIAVDRASSIAQKNLHFQDFELLLKMKKRLCKLDSEYLDKWWTHIDNLQELQMLNVEEIFAFIKAADKACELTVTSEQKKSTYRHFSSAFELLHTSEKVMRFLKLKDFRFLVQKQKRSVEFSPDYLTKWLADLVSRVGDSDSSHRAPFFIIELIAMVDCLKKNPELLVHAKQLLLVTDGILKLDLTKSDYARVNRIKFVLKNFS